jgi:serine/threonine-protein kinase
MPSASEIMDEKIGITCGGCGNSVPPSSRYCPACGSEFLRIGPGEILDGKYEILGKIGEGGMGEVYRARHLHLDDIRIIKIMKPAGLDDATQQRRFTEEARLATRLRHPNVAALYDFAKLPSGAFYMVWEFIDGETLLHRLRRSGTVGAGEAVEISLQVLAGLSEIHHAGVVHRDVSPDNIMIVEKNGRSIAKVIDLGIAKQVGGERPGMTQTGMFLGKLKYCSPEQAGALPASESLDGRSDLYSFGCVLYEMLAGRPLFQSATPEGYLAKHLQEKPPALPEEDLPPGVGSALAEIVARALEKDRRKRFQSAAEFASALSNLKPATRTVPALRTRPNGASAQEATRRLDEDRTGPTDLTPKVRRGRRIAGAITGICLTIGILAIGISWWRTKSFPEREQKTKPAAKISPVSMPATTTTAEATVPRLPGTPVPEETRAPKIVPEHPAARGATRHLGPEEAPRAPLAVPPRPIPAPASVPPDEIAAIRRLDELKAAAVKGSQPEIDALVGFVNAYVADHPDTPFSLDLKSDFPREVKSMAENQRAGHHVWKAMKLYEIYSRLSFAPRDLEVEARLSELRSRVAEGGDGVIPEGALEHTPILVVPTRQEIEIRAIWPGAPPGVSGKIFYRSRFALVWKQAPLTAGPPGTLTGRIPGEDVVPPFVGYYLEARDAAGNARQNGSAISPIRVRVTRR